MYNDRFRILEFGMSSGNNAEFVAKSVLDRTSNFEYVGLEHTSSYNQSMDLVFKKLAKLNVRNFELKPNNFETFKKLENKADLIIASHCLSFCKQDKFYSFMQNITESVKSGGVFMGELYLDKMSPRFNLNEESAYNLLSGLVDGKGNFISEQNVNSAIFNGFNVEAQLGKDEKLVHFVATKTNCQGTILSVRDNLIDYSNPKVLESVQKYERVMSLTEVLQNRGDIVNYTGLYSGVNMPSPLVQSYFDSEQGIEFLNNQIKENNMGAQKIEQKEIFQSSQEQQYQEEQAEKDINLKSSLVKQQTEQAQEEYENPEAWSVHFNEATERLPKGNPNGVADKDLKDSQKIEVQSQETQNDVPVQ